MLFREAKSVHEFLGIAAKKNTKMVSSLKIAILREAHIFPCSSYSNRNILLSHGGFGGAEPPRFFFPILVKFDDIFANGRSWTNLANVRGKFE